MFFKEGRRGRERAEEGGSLGETLAPPFTRVFKTDPTKYPCDLQDP
jgi:hypothetical protein